MSCIGSVGGYDWALVQLKSWMLTFESRVEEKASCSHQQVSDVGDEKYGIVAIFSTAKNPLPCQPHEHQVC
jgi:hypothetical protein